MLRFVAFCHISTSKLITTDVNAQEIFGVQEKSTYINVKTYWPSVVASGAMLLATDALSIERTLGSYILSSCDLSKSQLAEFAYLQGSSELLLKFAKAYDAYAGELLNEHIFDTWLQGNVTELREMILDENFVEMCINLTEEQRTELTVEWADDIQIYILTIDELRGSYVIPTILQVNLYILFTILSHCLDKISHSLRNCALVSVLSWSRRLWSRSRCFWSESQRALLASLQELRAFSIKKTYIRRVHTSCCAFSLLRPTCFNLRFCSPLGN